MKKRHDANLAMELQYDLENPMVMLVRHRARGGEKQKSLQQKHNMPTLTLLAYAHNNAHFKKEKVTRVPRVFQVVSFKSTSAYQCFAWKYHNHE
jgi:hypothetical protein